MTRYILTSTVACGGDARGFDQGKATSTCSIYATDWIIGRATGQEKVFSRASRRPKALESPEALVAGTAPRARHEWYEVGEAVEISGVKKVLVSVYDYEPLPEYHDAATQLKEKWGNQGWSIETNSRQLLLKEAKLKTLPKEHQKIFTPKYDAEALAESLQEPGIKSLTLSGSSGGHAAASQMTPDAFLLFDPLVGELSVPIDQVTSWFGIANTKKYLGTFNSIHVHPLGPLDS